MKIKLFVLFLFLLSYTIVEAQQEAQFSQNMFNHLFYNPGYAGLNNSFCITTIGRQQWLGLKETNYENNKTTKVAPQTYAFTLDANVNALSGGIGVVIFKDKLGYEDNTGLKFGYSFNTSVGNGDLGIGLMAGFLNKVIDFSGFNPIDKSDPLLTSKNKESDMAFDISFGAFYKVPGGLFAGISSTQLLETQISFAEAKASPKLKRHYFITGGYNYTLPNKPEIEIQPSTLVKTDFVSMQFDVNLLAYFRSQIWGGFSYRNSDALIFLVGMKPFMNSPGNPMESLGIGFAYDLTTSSLAGKGGSKGSLEFLINYCFKIKVEKPTSSYRNVRFL